MIRSTDNKFGKPLNVLLPGDYFATREDCILGTVAGACVCVCLYDLTRRIGGMGHFIVPGMIGTEGIVTDEIASLGITAMEYLMGEIVKLGGDRKYLKAKIFGVSQLKINGYPMQEIEKSNIRFLHEYFNLEQIKVESEDLGGLYRRKIFFYPTSGMVYRRFQRRNEDSSEFLKLELEYIDVALRRKPEKGKVLLFK